MEENEEYEVNPKRIDYKEEQRNQVLVRDGYVVKWDFQKWINAAKACVYVAEANPGAKSRQTCGMPHTQS